MTQFPDPVPLPDFVPESRKHRRKHLVKAARWGVVLRLLIVLAELAGFLVFDSYSLLMDGIASSLDIVCSLLLIGFMMLAARPPDSDHPFGHGRYEPLAGMQLGLLLMVVGGGMLIQQVFQVSEGEARDALDTRIWMIPMGAVILLEICYRLVVYAADKQNSPALKADAIHYRIDALTSLFAAVALGVGAIAPEMSVMIDHAGAMLIALLMVVLGTFAARKNIHQLMDKAPHSDYFEKVNRAALRVDGVMETEKVRIQLYGPDAHVDIDVEVDPGMAVDEAHKISQHVRAEIQKEWPAVRDVTVHIEPYYPNDH